MNNLPLECSHPDLFVDDSKGLDVESAVSMIELKSMDLVLIENAGELVRRVMQDETRRKGVFEYVLETLTEGTDTAFIHSIEFVASTDDLEAVDPHAVAAYRQSSKLISLLRKMPKKKRYITTIVGLQLDGGSGHYGSLFYDSVENVVKVFDSMQFTDDGKQQGFYTKTFVAVASAIFKNSRKLRVIVPDDIPLEKCLQFTGGFSSNPPLLSAELPGAWVTSDPIVKRDLHFMSTDSQNHFCYMWSLWVTHQRILDPSVNIGLVVREFEGRGRGAPSKSIDPLFIIKRYIYGVMNVLGLVSEMDTLGSKTPGEPSFDLPLVDSHHLSRTQPPSSTFGDASHHLSRFFNFWWKHSLINNAPTLMKSGGPIRDIGELTFSTVSIEMPTVETLNAALEASKSPKFTVENVDRVTRLDEKTTNSIRGLLDEKVPRWRKCIDFEDGKDDTACGVNEYCFEPSSPPKVSIEGRHEVPASDGVIQSSIFERKISSGSPRQKFDIRGSNELGFKKKNLIVATIIFIIMKMSRPAFDNPHYFMTRAEKAVLIATRVNELQTNPTVTPKLSIEEVAAMQYDPFTIAEEELRRRLLDLEVIRTTPQGGVVKIKASQFRS